MKMRNHIIIGVFLLVAVFLLSACRNQGADDLVGSASDVFADEGSFEIEDIEEEIFVPKNSEVITCQESLAEAEMDLRNAKKYNAAAESALLKATNALEAVQDSGDESGMLDAQAAFNAALKYKRNARDEVLRVAFVLEQAKNQLKC